MVADMSTPDDPALIYRKGKIFDFRNVVFDYDGESRECCRIRVVFDNGDVFDTTSENVVRPLTKKSSPFAVGAISALETFAADHTKRSKIVESIFK